MVAGKDRIVNNIARCGHRTLTEMEQAAMSSTSSVRWYQGNQEIPAPAPYEDFRSKPKGLWLDGPCALALGSARAPVCRFRSEPYSTRVFEVWLRGDNLYVFAEPYRSMPGPDEVELNDLYLVNPDSCLEQIWAGEEWVEDVQEQEGGQQVLLLKSKRERAYIRQTIDGTALARYEFPPGGVKTLAVSDQGIVYVGEEPRICYLDRDMNSRVLLESQDADFRIKKFTDSWENSMILASEGEKFVLNPWKVPRPDQGVFCIDIPTGERRWVYQREGCSVTEIQDAGKGRILCTWKDGRASMLDLVSGECLWEIGSGEKNDTIHFAHVHRGPEVVVLWFTSGILEARATQTGEFRWRQVQDLEGYGKYQIEASSIGAGAGAFFLTIWAGFLSVRRIDDGSLAYILHGGNDYITRAGLSNATSTLVTADRKGCVLCWSL